MVDCPGAGENGVHRLSTYFNTICVQNLERAPERRR